VQVHQLHPLAPPMDFASWKTGRENW